MPELPEVETVRRQLEPELVGKRIEGATVLDERLTRPEPPRSLERAVVGREVTAVARRGKYLLIGLEGGRTLAMHLRMTGNLLLRDPEAGATADLMKNEALGAPRLYEPAPEQIFKDLLPRHVQVQVYRALLESNAAFFAAQMTAMDAATRNSTDMIESLTLYMNKVRQAAITREIIEVVSGASAT